MVGTQANVLKLGELELGVRWVATEPELFYYRVVLHIYFRISLLSCILYHVAWKALILSHTRLTGVQAAISTSWEMALTGRIDRSMDELNPEGRTGKRLHAR